MSLDENVKQISQNCITVLNFSNKGIKNVEAKILFEALKFNQSLTTIDLCNNNIGDAEVRDLAETLKINKFIKTLHLGNNQIGPDGAKCLAEAIKINNTISTLNLCNNQIAAAGAKDLAEALRNNQSITNLNIGCNKIGDVGAKHLAETLKKNRTITSIYLYDNGIRDNGVKDLIEVLEINHSITTLNLDNSDSYINKVLTQGVFFYVTSDCNVIGPDVAKRVENALKINRKHSEKTKLKAGRQKDQKQLEEEETRVKIFKVDIGDDQFSDRDQAIIRRISKLIRDGNDLLQHHSKKGILLLGNTGAGKSTLAHLFSDRTLKAIFNEESAELIIEAVNPLKDIVIGHKMNSETKIPNKCFIADKDLTIWDCPGYNDTDPVQEIANSFYIKRIIETTEHQKFVLAIVDSDLISNRGNNFHDIISNFMKSFVDVKSVENSVSLVITHVPDNKNIKHIKKCITNIISNNQRIKDEHKNLVKKLLSSMYLFPKPNKEGDLVVENLLAQIDLSSVYSEVRGDMVKISISKRAKEYSSHLLKVACSNFNKLLDVIFSAIADSTKCLYVNARNVFCKNYVLIADWIPSSICYNTLQKYDKNEYFLELDFLSKLQKVLSSNQIISISDAIIILHQAIEVFAEYAEPDNVQLRKMIQSYDYCLKQQYDYVVFFTSVCEADLPGHREIAEFITSCHLKTTDIFEWQVISLRINEDKLDTDYYNKAIKYLEYFQDSPVYRKLKAVAYSCLGSIFEQNNEREAFVFYAKAIEANNQLIKVYEKLGKLLFKNNQYSKAIDCYKVINNAFKIEECFNEWLKQDKENPDVMLKQAEYFESMCLFEKAKQYYYYAIGLSQDNIFKATALKKVGKIVIDAAKGQDIITRAENYNFYNFDSVDKEFIDFFLSGTNI